MIATLACLALLSGSPQDPPTQQPQGPLRRFVGAELTSLEDGRKSLMIYHLLDPMDQVKTSPKHEWDFQFVTSGSVMRPKTDQFNLRMRIFSQFRKENPAEDIALHMIRTMLRLYDMNYHRLGLEHPASFLNKVDVYLCFGGEAGGEQVFGIDPFETDEQNRPTRANTIYIYQITSLTDKLEQLREISHEYGHATLPPVGGYSKPESWASGDVGERIYLRWLRDLLASGKGSLLDTMGATKEQLDAYIGLKVTPMVINFAKLGPQKERLALKDEAGYNAFVEMNVYAASILPPAVIGRAFRLMGGPRATALDQLQKFGEAAAEVRSLPITIPPELKGKTMWVPLNKGKLTGGKVLGMRGEWAKVQPTAASMTIANPPVSET